MAITKIGGWQLEDGSIPATKLISGSLSSSFLSDSASLIKSSTALGGDLSGTLPNPSVSRIKGIPVSSTAPAASQVLTYNGSVWAPADSTGGGGSDSIDVDAAIRIAQTNFKIDQQHSTPTNSLFNSWVDVFIDAGDIDSGLSSNYQLDGHTVVPTSQLIASVSHNWKCDESGSTSVLVDENGSANGTVVDSSNSPVAETRVAGQAGTALSLSVASGNTRAFLGNVSNWGGDWSVSLWAKRNGDQPGQVGLFGTRFGANSDDVGNPAGYFMFGILGTTNVYVEIRDNNGHVAAGNFGANLISDTNWHMYTAAWSASTFTMTIYFDGLPYGTWSPANAIDSPLGDSTRPMSLGIWFDPAQTFDGLIDEVFITETHMSDASVAHLFSTIVPDVGGATTGIVISKSHAALASPNSALLYAEGSIGLMYAVSRDNGTTWTSATSGSLVDISSQPSGTQMRYKVALPPTKILDNISLFWK